MAQLTPEQKNQRDNELRDLREVLNTEAGQRVLWRILSECEIFRVSFTGDEYTNYYEGRRSIGLFLVNEICEVDSDAFYKMHIQSVGKKKEARAQQARELESDNDKNRRYIV